MDILFSHFEKHINIRIYDSHRREQLNQLENMIDNFRFIGL
jgi:hypothetical protein